MESRSGRGRSNWDLFADGKGHISDGSTNAINTEFEKYYKTDLKLLADHGLNGLRFSFAWPRIQPNGPGEPDSKGLDLYDRIIDEMLALGIQPAATMIHWDLPLWAGDFRQRDITSRMADYVEILAKRYGDRIKIWLALNEPNTVATAGYALKIHAPGISSKEAMGAAIHHQALGQGLMIAAVRAHLPSDAKVGTTINLAPMRAIGEGPEAEAAQAFADDWWNRTWLDPLFGKGYPERIRPLVDAYIQEGDLSTIAAKPDFLGVNYYCRIYVRPSKESPIGFIPDMAYTPPNTEHTQAYLIEPDGFTETLLRVHREYGAPEIYVTETGFALDDAKPVNGIVEDPKRVGYLHSYLGAARAAIEEGVKLKGIFYWSATDNWEWAFGFSKTFGLVQVDRETQTRYPKRSLTYYGNCARSNAIAPISSSAL